ncbi:MAG: DNA-binding protein [Clostridiales bacterium GWB2_37_7]|nr:MAG: DNA-binding protein [Clostridiales bacterium GWB2_37_7]
MKYLEKSAKTIEEAIELALKELNATKDQVEIEVLEQPNKGIFGIIGSRLAKVKVTVKEQPKAEVKAKEIRETRPARGSEPGLPATVEDKNAAQKFIREVLDAMGIVAEIRIKGVQDSLHINLSGPKMGIIIGRRGQTLDSLQYLVSLVVNKDKGRDGYIKVILDTEDYRRKREETLVRLAKRLADSVVKTGKKVELEPMNPYERRIIHSALQSNDRITTFSEGEEPYRKVVIAVK